MTRARAWGYVASSVLCFLALMPLSGFQNKDSFPISTYPMFASRRGQPLLYKLVARFTDGAERPIAPELIAGGELLQAKAMITHAVRAGPKARKALCQAVAARALSEPSTVSAEEVQLQEVRYDALEYFLNPGALGNARVLERCRIRSETQGVP